MSHVNKSTMVPRHLPTLEPDIGEFSLNKSPIVIRHWLKMGYKDPIPVYSKCNGNEGLTNQPAITSTNLNNSSDAAPERSVRVRSIGNESLTNQLKNDSNAKLKRSLTSVRATNRLISMYSDSRLKSISMHSKTISMHSDMVYIEQKHRMNDNFQPLPPIKITRKNLNIVRSTIVPGLAKKDRDPRKASDGTRPIGRLVLASLALGRIEKFEGFRSVTSARKGREYLGVFVKTLMTRFEIKDQRLVRNIVTYAKSLIVPDTSIIDKNTLAAQFVHTFGITDLGLIDQICQTNQYKF